MFAERENASTLKGKQTTLREARIILINSAEHVLAMRDCLNAIGLAFGGYTQILGMGAWQPTEGNLLSESVRMVEIAYQPSRENDEKLYDIANEYRQAAKQFSVYLRYGNGHVQLVEAMSCMDNGEFEWEDFRKAIHRDADLLNDVVEIPEHAGVDLVNNHAGN